MISETISHYKILEKLGEGGMGIVYKTQDLKLDRLVALKFLPPHLASDDQDKKRFIHEAKAASSLDHPNICNVHEIDETPDGQVFIVMAIYEGTPLNKKIEKGPLKIEEALDVVIQAAEGLQAAHEKGIVHRDVKSSNIMMTDKRRAVIMDFGLARTGGATKLTKTGSTLGTVPYMSPEQARGEKVDHRTDIWSLGVVLYEMISGRLPFQSPYSEAIVYSILNEEPKPFSLARNDVPAEVENVVRKCLQKNPSNRYQHADELIVDLRRVKTGLGKEAPSLKIANPLSTTNDEVIRSIAVLPLDNLSRDPEQEYFVDGMADALNTELWKIGALKVISRTSAKLYKGVKKPLPEIARELGVDGLITGSVLREGEQVRITVQLIDGSTDRHLWAESYQRELRGILALHTEVAQAIAREIKIKLTPFEEARLMSVRRVDERAYDTYLKGLYHYNTFTQDGLKKAISLYEQSVQIDSTYAPAYAGLANTYNVMGAFGIIPWPQPIEKAKLATHKALELDSTLAEAHVSLAIISDLEWNWSQAEREWTSLICSCFADLMKLSW
ncbi:MAG: Adenylate cyclase [Bacteroidetes bacterium]|nr:Adenylate cyclase [Bacteroidota bacterium]